LAELNWTEEAETWLKDIYDYIAADNPDAAARTVTVFMNKRSYSNCIPKPDTSTNLNPLAPSAFFSTRTIESPI
jgi:hypothetical protein